MLEAGLQRLGDALKVGREKAGAEVPRGLGSRPRLAATLVGTHQQAVTLLPHIDLATEVDGVDDLLAGLLVVFDDVRDLLGEEVHVLHGEERRLKTDHAADLTGPQAPGVDDVLTVHRRLVLVGAGIVDDEIPATVGGAGDVANP